LEKLTDQNGCPQLNLPWGTLNAIDLNTGDIAYGGSAGQYPELTKKGIPVGYRRRLWWPISYGGRPCLYWRNPDRKFGHLLENREGCLGVQAAAGGFATPITYKEVDGNIS